jgi:hypothetical protein
MTAGVGVSSLSGEDMSAHSREFVVNSHRGKTSSSVTNFGEYLIDRIREM